MQTSYVRQALHLLISQQWEIFGKCRMRRWILRTKKKLMLIERKTEMSNFVLLTHFIFLHISTG